MFRFANTLKSKLIPNKQNINILFNYLQPISKSFSEIKVVKESNLKGYIHYVRKNAFRFSQIDPLSLNNKKVPSKFFSDFWGISHLDQIDSFPIDNTHNFNNTLLDKNSTVYELEKYLSRLYLKNVGVEFEHIDEDEEKAWLYENYENLMEKDTTNMELINAFKLLYPADLFEKFLHTKFPTFKRYSGEGANTLLVLLYSILAECSKKESQANSAILAMPHRGRLNVLPLLLDYPVSHLLSKIQGKRDMPKEIEGIDDVVSHVAVTNDKIFCMDGALGNYKPIRVSLLHNPSHLEAINPVAMGKTYAKVQDNCSNTESVLNITMHGDSALSAQGVIYESLSFHKSPKCNLGGTLHIVTNNQIGYTTQNDQSRSSLHCTDIFKTYSIPIIHVNSDDIESLIKVGKLAYMYKQKYKKDFVINLVCWRKYGHNEVDEPMFTQPTMYKCIKNKKESVEIFKNYLMEKNLIDDSAIKNLEGKYMKILNDEYKRSQSFELKLEDVKNEKFKGNKSLTHKWKGMEFPQFCKKDSELVTGVKNTEEIKDVLKTSVKLPDNFKVHSRLNQYFINGRLNLIQKGLVDWPGAEMAAFGTLLQEGFNVRISGQDVTRGTFSQRHIGFVDQETNEVYYPFADKNNFAYLNGRLEVNNSSLSEFAVMLFEYGYSWESPKNFVIWEAQFGDFVNGAQVKYFSKRFNFRLL
jgi:probable 2-oxoglutarate dehydrogenase E1 component DHKTD1